MPQGAAPNLPNKAGTNNISPDPGLRKASESRLLTQRSSFCGINQGYEQIPTSDRLYSAFVQYLHNFTRLIQPAVTSLLFERN